MTERERIKDRMAEQVRKVQPHFSEMEAYSVAEICLSVIEEPNTGITVLTAVCTCGNTGYNSIHQEGCALA